MLKKIIIKEGKVLKTGEGKYGKWQLIKVTTLEGEEFTTFDETFLLAESLNKELQVSVEEKKTEKNGRVYINKNIKLAVCEHCALHCPKAEVDADVGDDRERVPF